MRVQHLFPLALATTLGACSSNGATSPLDAPIPASPDARSVTDAPAPDAALAIDAPEPAPDGPFSTDAPEPAPDAPFSIDAPELVPDAMSAIDAPDAMSTLDAPDPNPSVLWLDARGADGGLRLIASGPPPHF